VPTYLTGPDVGWRWGMDAIGTELAANRLMYDEGIRDEESSGHTLYMSSSCVLTSSYDIAGEVVKRIVDYGMKIGSDIVNFFVFHLHDDDTSKHVLNLTNYNKDASPEAAHFSWVL
jgi:hypothetical protein